MMVFFRLACRKRYFGTACTRPFGITLRSLHNKANAPKNLACRLASPLPQVGAFLAKQELGAPLVSWRHALVDAGTLA